MLQSIINFFSGFPPELATFFMAMTPVAELRLSLPVAVLAYHLPVWEALLWSVGGTMVPVTLILLGADKFHLWLEKRSGYFHRAWLSHLAGAQRSFAKYQKFELIGLFVFTAVTLPGTGAFSAAIIAFILGIPIQRSWPYIFVGVVASGLIIAGLTVGLNKIF